MNKRIPKLKVNDILYLMETKSIRKAPDEDARLNKIRKYIKINKEFHRKKVTEVLYQVLLLRKAFHFRKLRLEKILRNS